MNFLIFSDTHGQIDRTVEMYNRMKGAIKLDKLIHCGDYIEDAYEMEKRIGIETIAVPGNCDGVRKRSYRIVETPSGNILVIHGHTENVKMGTDNLVYLAKELGCSIVCFGHTHCALNIVRLGVHLINPGSLTNPRDGSGGSCALLVASGGEPSASLIY